ncbi:MAG: ABC transporter ATP-binding protein/permease [Betaproteobacteria bacterium]|nr:ABC transporter ATP-binding protein/permease [Betaproteobacteria bacterium]MDH5223014.1 ABC transporter ATP-binding protein/permease [Betaproteobacteria bacterium]
MSTPAPTEGLRSALGYVQGHRAALAGSALLMVAESGMALAVPWLGGQLAGSMLGEAGTAAGPLILGLLVLFALQAVLHFGNTYVLGRSAERMLADLRTRLYDHLQALPLAFHHERRRGEVLALLTNDVEILSGFLSGTLPSVLPLLLTVAGAVVLMFRIDAHLALYVAVLVPLFYLLLKVLGRRLRPLARRLQEAHAGAVAIAEENLGMLPAIKTFTRETRESDRYRRQVRRIVRLSAAERRIHAALGPTLQFLAAAGLLLVLWLMSTGAEARSPAETVSFLLYAALLTRPVGALADVYGQARRTRGVLERLHEVLTEPPEPLLRSGPDLPPARGEVEFRDVHFAYPGRPAVLRGLNLKMRAGETLAITGENGAGKSTLAHLLMRLAEPDRGRVLVDGIDIAGVTLASLRRQIGIVPQHVLLFNGTVHDNIAYGLEGAGEAQVTAAARKAQAHEFIAALPQGYDSVIGDEGIRLSGGQRQRVALARALLKDPAILILDEATSQLDPEGERRFVEECRASLAGRTVILITHRPAALVLADRVVRLEDGVIAEERRAAA